MSILDPTMMTEMLKNNISNMVPMIVIGGVINWAFSGFLCSMYLKLQHQSNLKKTNYFQYSYS
jgi:fructose-specific phosphotransferase system IIC component